MRTALVSLAALIAGIGGTLAYNQFLGDGHALHSMQADFAKTTSDLEAARQEGHQAKAENDAMADQIKQLDLTKDDLKKQLDEAKSSAPAANPLPGNLSGSAMSGMIKAQLSQKNDERLQMLKSRLHLTPEQEAAVKAALDLEGKHSEEMAAKMFAGGKFDPRSVARDPNEKSVDQVLQDILTPDQKTGYQQMKTEEKNSSAEMMASIQMNQMSPLLQLNDTQKDQVVGALYQAQLDSQDPDWIKKNMSGVVGDPSALLDAQAKAKEDALAKILTPDQLATYHQQAQSQLNMQKAMMKNFMPASTPAVPSAPAVVAPAGTAAAAP